MATFTEIKAEVAVDISRSDLTTQIAQAVLDAVEYHSTERFWFNETRAHTFVTVAGTADYTITPGSGVLDFITIDWLLSTISGVTEPLTRIAPDEFEDLTLTSSSGAPCYWTYYNSTFRLYPNPDAVYTIRVAGHYRLTALSGGTDTNAWTTHARNLIRATCRKYLYGRAPIQEPEKAQIAAIDEDQELGRLRRETSRRRGTGIIKPWC